MKKIIFISLICVGLMCCTQTETQEKRIENTKKENADPTVKTDAKGGFKVLSFDKNVIPKEITLKGTIAEGAKWNDANGENMLILTTVAEFSSKKKKGEELEERDAELYAYHFVKKGDTYAELWKIQDYVRECPIDITCEFVPNTLTITDMDGNNIGESTLIYRTACRADVSPSTQKLIMHEGKTKLALRGTTAIDLGGDKQKATCQKDDSWKQASPLLLTYAEAQWKKFEKEF